MVKKTSSPLLSRVYLSIDQNLFPLISLFSSSLSRLCGAPAPRHLPMLAGAEPRHAAPLPLPNVDDLSVGPLPGNERWLCIWRFWWWSRELMEERGLRKYVILLFSYRDWGKDVRDWGFFREEIGKGFWRSSLFFRLQSSSLLVIGKVSRHAVRICLIFLKYTL